MSKEPSLHDLAKKRAVYQIPGMETLIVRKDVEYRAVDADALTLDIYYPSEAKSETPIPAVIIVAGYPDKGFQARLGCRFKEMGSSVSWGQLIAASGMAAITYTNREPATDLQALLDFLRRSAADLGIDKERLGLWASSGNAPLALSMLMQEDRNSLRCAVLSCGYTLDLDGASRVVEVAKMFGFANPCAGNSVADLPQDTPLFVVRAGLDECPYLNDTLDHFLSKALADNLPVTFINHPAAPHSFDLFHDSETSRHIIRQMLAFLRFHLLA
jgi:hypothetical protein